MGKFVGFIPEVTFDEKISRKVKLSSGLFLLPMSHPHVDTLTTLVGGLGYKLTGGIFLYYEGVLEADETPYEVFQGYCLALTFFYKEGRATCRAIKEIENESDVELFIDEDDQFGVNPDDKILLQRNKLKVLERVYARIESQLATKDFNPLRNSVEFFILFLKENQIRTRLLYLSICLESILLDGETNEVTYKLGLRCAKFLHKFDKTIDLKATLQEVKNGYILRSKIIHGDNYGKASSKMINGSSSKATGELDHVLILEKIVKNAYHFIFLNKALYEVALGKKLGEYIDQRFILKSQKN